MNNLPNPILFNKQAPLLLPFHNKKSKISIDLTIVKKEFNEFDNLTFKNKLHINELLSLCPYWLYQQANQEDLDLFLSMSKFDNSKNTFVTGCYTNSDKGFQLISYKHRRVRDIKWFSRKSTHPNSVPFIRIYNDNEPIYVIEGHHDSITAILLGLDFIMIPSASFRDTNILIKEARGKNIVFIVEDIVAYKTMIKIAYQLAEVASFIELIQLSNNDQKMDLSDYCTSSIREVKDGLQSCRSNNL